MPFGIELTSFLFSKSYNINMIDYILGVFVQKNDKFVIIDVGSIGFRVFVSKTTLDKMPSVGEKLKLYTWLQFREDTLVLYGFLTLDELQFFEILNTVAGVGPKTALNVLGIAPLDRLRSAIASGEAALFSKVAGVGKKTAERIVIELKSKFTKMSPQFKEDLEVEEALITLGYHPQEIREALRNVGTKIKGVEARIKEALKIFGDRAE